MHQSGVVVQETRDIIRDVRENQLNGGKHRGRYRYIQTGSGVRVVISVLLYPPPPHTRDTIYHT